MTVSAATWAIYDRGVAAGRRDERAKVWRRLFLAGVSFEVIARAWQVRTSTVENAMRRTLKVKS